MPYVALNNAASTLSGGVAAIDTAISVQIGHGAKFAVGANYSYLTLQDASSNIEIVKLTSVTGDVLNVVRAQDGTAARVWGIGDTIGCRPCAAGFNDFAVGPQITNSTSKVTPVDADELGVTDSAATFGLKKLTWANLKSTLVTYFNTLFTKVDGTNATGTWALSISGNAATATNATSATSAPTTAAGLVRATDLQSQGPTKFTTGGTGALLTGAPTPAIASNAAGQRFMATLHTAPTGSPTLAVSGLTALNFKYRDAAGIKQFVTSAQAPSGYPCDVLNDGTDWVLMNPIVRGMTATIGGLVPTPPNNTTTFLRGDGTFAAPSTVIFASAAETSAGTETTKAVNPSGLAQSTLGAAGQTWQDVTGSRANNTTYTNSTNRPIMVAIQGGGGGSAVTFTINGHTLYSSVQGIGAGSFAFSFIVPVGNSYSANSTTGSLAKWLELR